MSVIRQCWGGVFALLLVVLSQNHPQALNQGGRVEGGEEIIALILTLVLYILALVQRFVFFDAYDKYRALRKFGPISRNTSFSISILHLVS